MVRPRKHRCIEGLPSSFVYKPAGVPVRGLEWVELNIDEFESIRLLDHLGLDQIEAAEKMGVSRPTVTRIYAAARKKIADALTLGMAIRIQGDMDAPMLPLCPRAGMGRGHGCRMRQFEVKQENEGENHEDSDMLRTK